MLGSQYFFSDTYPNSKVGDRFITTTAKFYDGRTYPDGLYVRIVQIGPYGVNCVVSGTGKVVYYQAHEIRPAPTTDIDPTWILSKKLQHRARKYLVSTL